MSDHHNPLVRNTDEVERRWFYGGGLHSWLVRESEAGEGVPPVRGHR